MNWPYGLGIGIVSIILYKCNVVEKTYKWLVKQYDKAKFLYIIANGIKDVGHQNNGIFAINETGKSANLTYNRLGTDYILLIPFDRKKIVDMSQFKVELLRYDKDSVDITQQPGIPYMITAEQLGGYAIKVTNHESEIIYEYDMHTIPLYCSEVL